jgi:Lipocalin-like domain
MKTSFTLPRITLLLVLLSLMVMNCSKDNSPSVQIVGSWKFTNIYVKEGSKSESDQLPALVAFLPCVKDIVFIFKKSGDLSATSPTECQPTANNITGSSGTSKYEVKDDQLTLTDKSSMVFGVTFSGKTMTWISSSVSGNITTTTRFVLTKQ